MTGFRNMQQRGVAGRATVWAGVVKHPQKLSSEHQSLARQVLEFGTGKQQ